ncbi:hypothetical protein LguiA_016272 [Lonicera macranthoides]
MVPGPKKHNPIRLNSLQSWIDVGFIILLDGSKLNLLAIFHAKVGVELNIFSDGSNFSLAKHTSNMSPSCDIRILDSGGARPFAARAEEYTKKGEQAPHAKTYIDMYKKFDPEGTSRVQQASDEAVASLMESMPPIEDTSDGTSPASVTAPPRLSVDVEIGLIERVVGPSRRTRVPGLGSGVAKQPMTRGPSRPEPRNAAIEEEFARLRVNQKELEERLQQERRDRDRERLEFEARLVYASPRGIVLALGETLIATVYSELRVKNLKVLGSQGWTLMREGEAEKQKQYIALVGISQSLNGKNLKTTASLKDMSLTKARRQTRPGQWISIRRCVHNEVELARVKQEAEVEIAQVQQEAEEREMDPSVRSSPILDRVCYKLDGSRNSGKSLQNSIEAVRVSTMVARVPTTMVAKVVGDA